MRINAEYQVSFANIFWLILTVALKEKGYLESPNETP